MNRRVVIALLAAACVAACLVGESYGVFDSVWLYCSESWTYCYESVASACTYCYESYVYISEIDVRGRVARAIAWFPLMFSTVVVGGAAGFNTVTGFFSLCLGVFVTAFVSADYLLRVGSDLTKEVNDRMLTVYMFFVKIFLSDSLWDKCLAGSFLLGVACMIVVAWGFLIYTDYLDKPENITWMKGSELGKFVLSCRKDFKETCNAFGKGITEFLTGLYGLTCAILFLIVIMCYILMGLVFGVICAVFLTLGLMYGTCWAIKDGAPFILRPSHSLKSMMQGPAPPPAPVNAAPPAPPPAPVNAAPPARAIAFAPRARDPRQRSPARDYRQRSPARVARVPFGDAAVIAAGRAARRGPVRV